MYLEHDTSCSFSRCLEACKALVMTSRARILHTELPGQRPVSGMLRDPHPRLPAPAALAFGTGSEVSHPVTPIDVTLVPRLSVFSVSQVRTHPEQKRCSVLWRTI